MKKSYTKREVLDKLQSLKLKTMQNDFDFNSTSNQSNKSIRFRDYLKWRKNRKKIKRELNKIKKIIKQDFKVEVVQL